MRPRTRARWILWLEVGAAIASILGPIVTILIKHGWL